MDIGSIPLGMLPENDVQTGVQHYSENTKVVFYTDGVIEEEKQSTRENIEKLKVILSENRHLAANELFNQIISTVFKAEYLRKISGECNINCRYPFLNYDSDSDTPHG